MQLFGHNTVFCYKILALSEKVVLVALGNKIHLTGSRSWGTFLGGSMSLRATGSSYGNSYISNCLHSSYVVKLTVLYISGAMNVVIIR